ncbi:AbiH family protein [Flavobacterium chungnamense]
MKLYIVGNGFDLGHGIPCEYSDFRNYLLENRRKRLNIDTVE